MKKESIRHIVAKVMGVDIPAADIKQLVRSEDGSAYDVWHIKFGKKDYLLKKVKSNSEEDFYRITAGKSKSIVDYWGGTDYYGKRYMLTEYFTGHEMCKCTRKDLKRALDALISLQDLYWVQNQNRNELNSFGTSVQEETESILRRREYLLNPVLEKTLDEYVTLFPTIPLTLCHNDLLPFNVLVGEKRAVIIDWEYYGILPYPISLARLLAHTKPDPNWDFSMSDEDKAFAIDYYYDHLVKGKGILYPDYRRTLDYCMFYELTEWIYICRKYKVKQPQRLEAGLKGVAEIAERLHPISSGI